jgi:hypothetical protein
VQLARHADRCRLAVRVEDVDLRVVDRLADRGQGLPVRRPVPEAGRRDDVALRRPVLVLERAPVERGEEGPDHTVDLQLLAGRVHLAQGAREPSAAARRLGQPAERDEGQEQPLHRVPHQVVEQPAGIPSDGVRDQHQRPPGAPRREDLLERDVEAQRRELERPGTGCEARSPDLPLDEVREGGPRHRHALGLTGRAGGVDHVAEVGVRTVDDRRCGGPSREGRPDARDDDRRDVGVGPARPLVVGQEQAGAGVLDHEAASRHGVRRVDRHVGPARPEDRQDPDHHVDRAVHGHGHRDVGPHATLAQVVRELVGSAIQLGVAQPRLVGLDRRGLGGAPNLLVEARQERPRGTGRRRGVPLPELRGLVLGQQRQPTDLPVGVVQGGREEQAELSDHRLHRPGIELGAVLEAQRDARVVTRPDEDDVRRPQVGRGPEHGGAALGAALEPDADHRSAAVSDLAAHDAQHLGPGHAAAEASLGQRRHGRGHDRAQRVGGGDRARDDVHGRRGAVVTGAGDDECGLTGVAVQHRLPRGEQHGAGVGGPGGGRAVELGGQLGPQRGGHARAGRSSARRRSPGRESEDRATDEEAPHLGGTGHRAAARHHRLARPPVARPDSTLT